MRFLGRSLSRSSPLHGVMTTLPRAWPSPTYPKAAGISIGRVRSGPLLSSLRGDLRHWTTTDRSGDDRQALCGATTGGGIGQVPSVTALNEGTRPYRPERRSIKPDMPSAAPNPPITPNAKPRRKPQGRSRRDQPIIGPATMPNAPIIARKDPNPSFCRVSILTPFLPPTTLALSAAAVIGAAKTRLRANSLRKRISSCPSFSLGWP